MQPAAGFLPRDVVPTIRVLRGDRSHIVFRDVGDPQLTERRASIATGVQLQRVLN